MEAIGAAVGADLPALGNAWLRSQGFRILDHQTLEQRLHDVGFRDTSRDMRIDALGLGAVAEVQDAGGVTRLNAVAAA